jgi:beta-lactamase regulating signal transducer with metallopeptidase domain
MPELFIYLLKLSLSLAVVFLFYHVVLRKLTFYNWNRWYLLGFTLLSFLIPFIDISNVLQQKEWTENSIVQWVPVIHQAATDLQTDGIPKAFTAWNLVSLLLIAGMVVMLVRLLTQFLSFHQMVKKAEPLSIGSVPGSRMKLYQVNENIIPFSFGNAIFINQRLHSREELQEIVWHEFIHVKQKHSLDIICGELVCLLNWYNPFAWLLRHSIRQNLEFIADHKVLEQGISRREYQYLLLKVTGNHHFSIAPKFNFSSLKKRIAMMNKMKSAGVHLVKFLFILPLVAVLLVAFRGRYQGIPERVSRPGNTINDTIPLTERNIPIRKIPAEIASISVMAEINKGADAVPLHEKKVGKVMIKRKDGTKEQYDMDNKNDRIAFEKKYGVKLEDILPPPPPPPPAPLEMNTVPPAPPKPPVPPDSEHDVKTAPAAR